MNQPSQLDLSLEEIYIIVGELEVVRRKLNMQVQGYLKQIDEMSAEITRLREENGRLAQTDNNE
jgi:hypothetical protein